MKTKLIWLAAVTLLAAVMISGTVFAEGEEPPALPEAPAAAAPAASEPPAEAPAAPAEAPSAPAEPAADLPAEEQPAPTEAPVVDTPTEETPEEFAPVAETPVDGQSAPSEAPEVETPAAEAPAIEAAAPDEVAPAQAVEEPVLEVQPAEEPVIQLVDAEGETLDMASQESADLLSSGDPYWTAGGLDYSSVTTQSLCYGDTWANGRCFISATPIQNAINLIAGDSLLFPTDGYLYIDYGVYPDVVVIDGDLYPALQNLIGIYGEPVVDGGPYPVLTKSVTLKNLDNGFILNGFTITGGLFVNDSNGSFELMNVTAPVTFTDIGNESTSRIIANNHKGNVSMTGVTADGNSGDGAFIDNHPGGSVTINSSFFNNNDGAGVRIVSSGAVTLNTVTADGNDSYSGINIDTHGLVTLTSIKANGNTNSYGGYDGTGIQVLSSGAVNVNSVVANDNQGYGLDLSGRGVTIRNVIARSNGIGGLLVDQSTGAILLENVVANDNNGDVGVFVNTPANLGTLTLRNMTASNNAQGGIRIETSGAVTINNSTTNDNYRDNDPGDDTGGDGLYITTKGAVMLTTIWSSGNGVNGLFVEGIKSLVLGSEVMYSPSSITLTSPLDSNFANFFSQNGRLAIGGSGIKIVSQMPVTLRNFTTRENQDNGVYVTGPVLNSVQKRSGAVTIASTIPNWRNRVEYNNIGVNIYSAGTVNLSSLDSSENNEHAVDINTSGAITLSNVRDWGNRDGDAVVLKNTQTSGYMPVTITNLEVRENRDEYGIAVEVFSRGAITINGLWIEDNHGMGASLNNDGGGRGTISLTKATIQNNASLGIQAFSNGAILFTNVLANNNGYTGMSDPTDTYKGAYLANYDAPTAMPVTLTDCVFESNQGTGLTVRSKGLISLRGVESRWNYIRYGSMYEGTTFYETNQPDWGGVDEIDFDYYSGESVTIILRSLDEWNGFQPIVELVDANGDPVGANSENNEDGIWTSIFYSETLTTGQTYTIRVQFDDSFSNGYGKYSLSVNDDLEEYQYIPADGAVLDNTYSETATPAGVVMSPTTAHPYNMFDGNNGNGLNIKTRGAVTLTSLWARDNAFGNGLHMDNPEAVGAVIVQSLVAASPGGFISNGGNGLFIRTHGAITLSNIEAFNNHLSGADLDNGLCTWDGYDWTSCLGTGGITIKAPSGMQRWFNDNRNFGIWAVSKGAITLTNISAYGNGWDGAFLWNDGRNSAANITVNTAGAVRNEFNENARNTTDPAPWFNTVPDGFPDWFYEDDYYWARFNGLTVISGGNISILNTNVNWNQNDIGGGIVAINEKASTAKTVTISSAETQGNFSHGIAVRSIGTITLTNIYASDNGSGGGIHLENALCTWDEFAEVWINCQGTGAVKMTNIDVNNNQSIGLQVYSRGLITLTGAWANNNQGSGIHLDNNFPALLAAGITMTNINANNNWDEGLEALSRGLISLNIAETSNNWDGGINLQNNFEGSMAGITIISATANNNGDTGIFAQTNGVLILTSLTACDNAKKNESISNGETVQDFYNEGRGLDNWFFDFDPDTEYTFTLRPGAYSDWLNRINFVPMIQLIDPNAENGWENPLIITGLFTCNSDECVLTFKPLDDLGYSDPATLVLQVGSSNGDGYYRLSMNDNPDDEPDQIFWVDGLSFYAGGDVKMTGYNSFNNNSLAGIYGTGGGNISVANVGAFGNSTEGISLDNMSGEGSITMTGTNIANNNGWEGLVINTNGAVNLNNLEASFNGYRGGGNTDSVDINAYGIGKTVRLTNVKAMHNCMNGITLDVNGITTFSNVRAWLNGDWGPGFGSGVHMDSHGYAINLLNYCSFMGNADSGFAYDAYGGTVFFNPTNSVFLGNRNTDLGPYNE